VGVGFGRRPFLLYARGREPARAPLKKKMARSDRNNDNSSEPFLKVRQILILVALVLVFAFAVRLATGDPLPHDLRNLIQDWLGMKHGKVG
jgi:hypothetical protein